MGWAVCVELEGSALAIRSRDRRESTNDVSRFSIDLQSLAEYRSKHVRDSHAPLPLSQCGSISWHASANRRAPAANRRPPASLLPFLLSISSPSSFTASLHHFLETLHHLSRRTHLCACWIPRTSCGFRDRVEARSATQSYPVCDGKLRRESRQCLHL